MTSPGVSNSSAAESGMEIPNDSSKWITNSTRSSPTASSCLDDRPSSPLQRACRLLAPAFQAGAADLPLCPRHPPRATSAPSLGVPMLALVQLGRFAAALLLAAA